jgi:hypothetical protein
MAMALKIRTIVYTTAVLFYMATAILPSRPWFHPVGSTLAVVALAVSLPAAGRIVKIISALFLAGGGVLAITHGIPQSSLYLLFGKMMDLLSLFTLIPFMAIPVLVGNYSSAIMQMLAHYAANERSLYRVVMLIGYGLASVMNLAALPMAYYSIQPAVKRLHLDDEDKFMEKSIVFGYAMPLVWSPIAAVVGGVVQVTRADWFWILPFSLILSAIGVALGFLLSPRAAAAAQTAAARDNAAPPAGAMNPWWKLGQMLAAIVTFVAAMTVLQKGLSISIVTAVTLLSIPFAAAWSLLLRQSGAFFRHAAAQIRQIGNLHDQFAVFLSAGFFVTVLRTAGLAPAIDGFLVQLSHTLGTTWFLVAIPLLPVLLSMVGMHPLVSIALLGESLNPSVIGIRPEWVAVAYLGGGVTTFILSPFNATLTVMGGILKRNPLELMKWNLPFCILYLAVVIGLVTVLHLLWP